MQDIFADFKDVYLRNVSLDNAEKIPPVKKLVLLSFKYKLNFGGFIWQR